MKRHVMKKHPENHPFLKNVTISKTYKCKLCNYTSDQSNNVTMHVEKKHVEKQNEKKTPQKWVVMEKHTAVDEAALKNSIVGQINEYERKLELGRGIKEIVLELNAPTACLSAEHREALELFEKHGQANDVKPVRP